MAQTSSFGGKRLLVVAFEGWNDAGDAASGAVETLEARLRLGKIWSIDPEPYYDFQFLRPEIGMVENGRRTIAWPGVSLYGPAVQPSDDAASVTGPGAESLHVLRGGEPARAWKAFAAEVIDAVLAADIDGVVFLGSMLADVPHTRPLAVFATSENAEVRQALGLEQSMYAGPIGIMSVLMQAAEESGLPTISLWVSVPHYAHALPSPKAELALLGKLEELTGLSIPRGEIEADAAEWEAAVNAMAADDDDLANYVRQLENARDTIDAPDASGEAIAREFEQYLRRRGGTGSAGDEPWRPGGGR